MHCDRNVREKICDIVTDDHFTIHNNNYLIGVDADDSEKIVQKKNNMFLVLLFP